MFPGKDFTNCVENTAAWEVQTGAQSQGLPGGTEDLMGTGVFDEMKEHGHEQLIFCRHKDSGLRALIAIHDTTIGPGLGGCRMWDYASESEVITDALRLSMGMTYKSAASGCNYGGAKAVIWGDPSRDKTETMFRAFGRFIEGLGGRFITGTDVGTDYYDFVWSLAETDNLVALPEEYGGSGSSSVITAYGVYCGMKACADEAFGSDSLKGLHIAVQGVGKVGTVLLDHLRNEGARLTVTDIDADRAREAAKDHGADLVDPDEIYDVECDIFSPCALGAVINDDTIPRLKCKVVAGAANNQLAEPRHGDALHERGILYAPDYVINAGGLIQVACERAGLGREHAMKRTAGIYDLLKRIFAIAGERSVPTYRAADVLAGERIERLGLVRRTYLPATAAKGNA